MQKSISFLVLFLVLFSSCVTPKIHNALIAENEIATSDLSVQQKKTLKLQSAVEELDGEISSLKSKIYHLINDSIQNGGAIIVLQKKYDSLSDSYDLLASKNSREIANKAKEIKQLLEQLNQAQLELFTKEDELSKLSSSLESKEEELILAQQGLNARSTRVSELESIINKKDSLVTALKQTISKALIGLEGEGLTIEQRNGKVYISLEEELLFASGKYEVNLGGITALNKLAMALASQKDLEILVEGHTDSITFSSKGLIKDNWDLSVMRATNVVKVLTMNTSLNPVQLTAAGRAEFVPIASNKSLAGRSANRRIEMILSPNLDDLFKLLEE
jgi:chemotaxis protein MotB